MIIKEVKLENYTVFESQQIEYCPGINTLQNEKSESFAGLKSNAIIKSFDRLLNEILHKAVI